MPPQPEEPGPRDGPPPRDEPGLRERKKDQTRRTLRECGARLFQRHGFAGTTVADIAACANVSERTFFRYFESKEALLLPDSVELFAYIEAAVAERPADEDPMRAVCQALLSATEPFEASSPTALTRALEGEGTDALVTALMMRAFSDFEERLTQLVLKRLPPDEPDVDLHAAVIACAAVSAARAVLRTQRARRAAGTASAGPARLLPTAFDFLHRIGQTAS